MFKNVNIGEELLKNRGQRDAVQTEELLNEAFDLLYQNYCQDERIEKALTTGEQTKGAFSWSTLDGERIFNLKEIRKTCLQQRLRFLDSKQFKDEIPYEAKMEIKRLERELGVELGDFKIMAPSERFVLEDCDKDPLLFLKLSDNYYYLIHQWGNDLAWHRRVLSWPLQSFTTLGITIAAVSLLLSMLVPTQLIVGEAMQSAFFAHMALFFWCLICITSIVTYIGFAFFKNVTVYQWNSPFFKQEF
jgi:hypothetical protein